MYSVFFHAMPLFELLPHRRIGRYKLWGRRALRLFFVTIFSTFSGYAKKAPPTYTHSWQSCVLGPRLLKASVRDR